VRVKRKVLATTAVLAAAAGTVAAAAPWASAGANGSGYEPVLNPADFSTKIDNPYFPLPVGRTLVYRGFKDGETRDARVTVTKQTKVVKEGITARVVSDVVTHKGALREKTQDWFAQDKQGNVWYLGEDTTSYNPDGTTDKSGSWEAGVKDAEPGLIMEANPRIPDSYRQEFLQGEAEDTAWVVDRGGSITVPYGTLSNVLTSLEATHVEPGTYDQKVYAPGVGLVVEQALTSQEFLKLVSVSG
jgi:hypothetical protein